MLRSILLFCCLIFATFVFSQKGRPSSTFPNGRGSGIPQNSGQNPVNDNNNREDSIFLPFNYIYYNPLFANDKKSVTDTSLNNFFNDIEIAKRRPFNALNTGNNGSSPLPVLFDFKPFTGFHAGYHQYDAYNFSIDSIKIYNTKRTFSDLFFSQIVGSQSDIEVGAEFGQEFAKGTKLSLSYRRVFQNGFYNQQSAKTTNLALSLAYKAFKNNIKFATGIIANNNNENHNGGIDTTGNIDLTRDVYSLRINVPTILSDANTRYAYQDIFHITEFALKKINQDTFQSSIGHLFLYKKGTNRFGDIKLNDKSDSIFYGLYNTDIRGIRNFSKLTQISNEFFIKGSYKWASGKLGLVYDLYNFENVINKSINDITLKFKGDVAIGKSVLLNTEANFGLGANAGNFSLKGATNINVGKYMSLLGNAEIFRSQLSVMDEIFYLNNELLYQKDFSSTFGSKFFAKLIIPSVNTSVSVGQNLINNFVYRDVNDFPVQDQSLLSATYISIANLIKIWKINLETHAYSQSINKGYIPVPNQYLKSNLFFEGLMFKRNLLLRLGLEYKYIPAFNLPAYNPATGMYYNNGKNIKKPFEGIDVYLSAKVSKFRIFVKYENLAFLFNPSFSYLTINHPVFDAKIRYGVRWLLYD
jgi:hypothetical protein